MKVCGLFSEVKTVGGLTLAALELMSSVLNPGCRPSSILDVVRTQSSMYAAVVDILR